MPRVWKESPVLQRQKQHQNWQQADDDTLGMLKRSIMYEINKAEYRAHPLQGHGQQGILDGCYAMDFKSAGGGGGPGRWRLLYNIVKFDDINNFEILLFAILDYHGGQRYAPLYPPGAGNVDLQG